MEEKLKIFFCEDDENLGMLLREYLQAKGYVTDLFSDCLLYTSPSPRDTR